MREKHLTHAILRRHGSLRGTSRTHDDVGLRAYTTHTTHSPRDEVEEEDPRATSNKLISTSSASKGGAPSATGGIIPHGLRAR